MSSVIPPQPHRRVSARRGSTTAPDPFGIHSEINLNPNRSTSSTLTIVRVTPQTPQPINLHEPPSGHVISQRRVHRFLGHTGNHGQAPTTDNSTNRVSFAFSSFGNSAAGPRPSSPSGGGRESPSSSPRLRPSSPHLGPTSSFAGKPRLTPDQLVDVARQATSQRPQLPSTSGLSSPGVTSPGYGHGTIAPATFTPLPDDIYLPFIDRPAEVASMISSPPDAKLFTLLAQTFRKKDNAADASTSPPSVSNTPSSPTNTIELPRDPTQWTYNQLIQHLTLIDRDIAPDFIWAIAARKCILSHSELLWERIKGALGVPPELDVDYDFLVDDDTSSIHTSDISDDEGRGASGHWSDWDAVMDSPIYARPSNRLSMESPSPSLYFSGKKDDQEAAFRAQVDERLNNLPDGSGPSVNEEGNVRVKSTSADDTIVASTPHIHGGYSPGLLIGHFSPPTSGQCDSSMDGYVESHHISIQPLLFATSPPPSTASNPPPPATISLGALDPTGLGNIAEGAEEEEEEEEDVSNADMESTTAGPTSVTEGGDHSEDEDPNLISPSQIQGLKISTSPTPAPFASTPPIMSPVHSPMNLGHSQGSSSLSNSYSSIAGLVGNTGTQPISFSGPQSRTHSRASSFSSIGPFQRSESLTNLASSWGALAAAHAAAQSGSGSQYAASVIGSDAGDSSGYISDGDTRMSGAPLFPSNFSRLAGVPTLRANNPATKPPSMLPQARYISNVTYGGPSLANRPGKVRAYSHGASSSSRPGFNLTVPGNRQSWGNAPQNVEPKQ